MADRRRRRRRASQDSEDDDGSGSGSDSGRSASPTTKTRAKEPEPAEVPVVRPEAKNNVESECESEDGVGEAVLSDYESADPEDNGSHSEGVEEEEEAESDEEAPAAPAASESEPPAPSDPAPGEEGERVEDNEDEQQQQQQEEQEQEEEEEQQQQQQQQQEEEPQRKDRGERAEESKAEEKENLSGERQSGDGQESTDDPETKVGDTPGQKLDDDEDRKNPAYIPRKGLFFEHDVRGHAQEEERPKGRKGRLWKDEGRWEHDKFREEEQAPKSREELIAIYGYDIRNGGGPGDRSYRQRRPRQSVSPARDKRWREGGGERAVRSWQGGGGGQNRGVPPPSSIHTSTSSSSLPLSAQRSNNPSRAPPPRSRPSYQNQMHLPPQSHYRNDESNAPQMHPRERQGPKAQSEPAGDRGVVSRGGRGGGGRGGPYLVIENSGSSQPGVEEKDLSLSSVKPGAFQSASPRRQQKDQRADRSVSGSAASSSDPPLQSSSVANREASPPTERPVERKSYALARRTRSRPTDLGSKQPSVDETTVTGNASSPVSAGGRSWTGDAPGQTGSGGGGGGLAELDADVARLSLAGQSWNQSPTSYIRSEMRGLPSPLHIPAAPPQFSSMEEMGVATNRAKRYSSQRQRAVPEPAPPMHLGVMDGHYYEPMSYQGPIYAHGDGPTPIPPQGMLVQPEMHLPHPGLHPHQSGAPIANPALYAGPPVALSPGQPQQLLPPPFYPPPGVMTFPYPTMYPTPQAQAQVTYGGVTYYDTMQQQAQPKPSPPRRTSQAVTVKPPPPEVPFASE
ncbi:protein CASC3 [Platichthys flesus]|uniref:protein CASC3 n=1 Tax=Platichthys flesus TaxID=8260 RepID=UPI002DB9D09A|nr:protein CASC3 [Platichthys flesus]